VVWAVAKGSMVNKAILVPSALAIARFAPWAITPLLMVGGAFLCFEGFEKIAHKLLHPREEAAHHKELTEALLDPTADLVAVEKDKIKGAIRTDFILSAEIIVISLGTVAAAAFGKQVAVLVGIALLMTVGVYGLVAGIVKLDDAGLHLSQRASAGPRNLGRAILAAAPWLMRSLAFAGTAAMFLVGGGILSHGIPPIHHFSEELGHRGGLVGTLGPLLVDAATGIVAGGLIVAVVTVIKKMRGREAVAAASNS
jgi:predicted DNA repair protein MutK